MMIEINKTLILLRYLEFIYRISISQTTDNFFIYLSNHFICEYFGNLYYFEFIIYLTRVI